MNNDLISREALKKALDNYRMCHCDNCTDIDCVNCLYEIIDNAPTVTDHSVEIAQKSIELGRSISKTESKIENARPQGDLISREALKEDKVRLIDVNALKYKNLAEVNGRLTYILTAEEIDNAPTVTSYTLEDLEIAKNNGYKWGRIDGKKERPQGEWTIYNAYYKTCPFCKRTVGVDFLIQSYENPPKRVNFCPNCGADMKGGAE